MNQKEAENIILRKLNIYSNSFLACFFSYCCRNIPEILPNVNAYMPEISFSEAIKQYPENFSEWNLCLLCL